MNCPNCGSRYNPGEEICIQCGQRLPVNISYAGTGPLSPGTILHKRYKITSEHWREGGQGFIYFAEDLNAENKLCVVKQVKQPVTSSEVEKKLREEAQRMADLSRAIGGRMAEILEDFVEDGRFYVVQQRIFGDTLEDVYNSKKSLSEAEVVGWAIQCCKVLKSIHDIKAVHRDISPDNLMLTEMGDVMFIDFGTLREFQRIIKGTAGMGKFGYTPPEQWTGNAVAQSDIFALAATCYFLLTGFLPLSDELKRGQGPQRSDFAPVFPPVRKINQNVSSELEEILSRALQLDVDKRYRSAEDMRKDLEKLHKKSDRPPVYCPKCSHANEADLVYCKRCRAVLYPGSQKCPQCNRAIPVNAKFCPHDGARV